MDVAFEQDMYNDTDILSTCKMQWYNIAMLLLIFTGIIFIVTTKVIKLRLFRGHLFSNVVKSIALYIRCTILRTSKIV